MLLMTSLVSSVDLQGGTGQMITVQANETSWPTVNGSVITRIKIIVTIKIITTKVNNYYRTCSDQIFILQRGIVQCWPMETSSRYIHLVVCISEVICLFLIGYSSVLAKILRPSGHTQLWLSVPVMSS